jgi:hypothetical protein
VLAISDLVGRMILEWEDDIGMGGFCGGGGIEWVFK